MKCLFRSRYTPIALAWLLAMMVCSWTAAESPPRTKPNVLFLLADDLRPDGIGALGNPHVKTPNLDRLVEQGRVFHHAYVFGSDSGAVCMPSRTMIYTGCQLFNHKGRGSGEALTFPQAMKRAGYATIRSGKFGNNPNDICKAFDVHLNGFNAERNTDNILKFIREHAGKEPMFLNLASNEPHDPQFAPPEFYPLYKPEDIPLPVNFLPQHLFDNGEMSIRDEATLPWPRTRESVTGKLARYYASITYWDAQAGRIIQALKDAGQYENTYIIIAGDNGLSLGEHGLLGKQNVYEFGGMHVPLVFLGPGISRGQTDAFAYLMDIFPTVCELVGTPIPAGLDAKSLLPILTGQASGVREYAFTSYREVQRSIRDQRWKLIRYPLINRSQLFDLEKDPHEMQDLAADPAHAGKLREMMALLVKAQKEYGDGCALTSEHPADASWSPDKVPASIAEKKKGEWQPVTGRIMTPWASKVDPQHPLPEYPRPQMSRQQWLNLNGLWDFVVQPLDGIPPEKYEEKILVPFPIESALSGVKKPLTAKERLWYHRKFKCPELVGDQRLLLHFGAVDWETKVSVNGKLLGEHRGGYDPFSFDITDAVRSRAENEIVVAVFDPTGGYQPKGKQNFNKIAKPGGIAYTPASGIWQTVWLEAVPATHIESLKITPDVTAGVVRLTVIARAAAADTTTQATGWDGERLIGQVTGKPGAVMELSVPNAHLWTPNDPFLYTLKVRLGDDEVTSYFGMRQIAVGRDEKGPPRILLNGKFIFQSGPLDQGYWPDGIYTAPTDEALRFDIEEMKKLGFNMVRKHLKVEPERWYYWCDKLGLLVWQDMPCGDGGTAVSKDRDGVVRTAIGAQEFEAELKAMIETHGNHPAIIIWTIFNEGWGQYDTPRLTRWVKELDPSRLINSTSGWHDQHVGDIVDTHSYPGPAAPGLEAARPGVLGEFGGLGLGIFGHSWVPTGAWGYRTMSGAKELTRREVELWRRVWQLEEESGLCAAVYTQLTDVETECNGLLTYDRRVEKVDVNQVADAHRGKFAPNPVYQSVLATAQKEPVTWRYTLNNAAGDWAKNAFDDSGWKESAAGFGTGLITNRVVRTLWDTEELWLRRQFVLTEAQLRDLALKVSNEGDTEIYLNGVLAVKLIGRNANYEELDILPEAEKALKAGSNVIAAHCRRRKTGQRLDIGLVRECQK